MDKILFPYYSGNIYKSKSLGYVSLDYFIDAHLNPKKETVELMDKISEAISVGDKKLKASLKCKLNAFTPSVLIKKERSRKYTEVQSFTGLMQIDLDKIPTEQGAVDLKEHIFHQHPEIVCAYLSPSRRGIKALMKIDIPKLVGGVYSLEYAISKYKAMHKAVENEFEEYGYFDSATKNCILPLFLSYDKNLLSRKYSDAPKWRKENWIEKDYENLNQSNNHKYHQNINYGKSVDLVVDAVNNITDNGHPQVRSASLILGSRVGAGYIDKHEAVSLMEMLITSNSYLKKGIGGYIKTSIWGIETGMNNPKYY